MTDEEKIKFIAEHPRMKFGDMRVFLKMSLTDLIDFIDEHEDKIGYDTKVLDETEVSE